MLKLQCTDIQHLLCRRRVRVLKMKPPCPVGQGGKIHQILNKLDIQDRQNQLRVSATECSCAYVQNVVKQCRAVCGIKKTLEVCIVSITLGVTVCYGTIIAIRHTRLNIVEVQKVKSGLNLLAVITFFRLFS